jgi:hypothetical protein
VEQPTQNVQQPTQQPFSFLSLFSFFSSNQNDKPAKKPAEKPVDNINLDIESGCANNDRASVLIENIPNGISFNELNADKEFILEWV